MRTEQGITNDMERIVDRLVSSGMLISVNDPIEYVTHKLREEGYNRDADELEELYYEME